MQEAMLVHTLGAVRSEINFEQSCMRIRGPLDHEAFRHAWATVFERHDVLRTAFHWRGLARPLQVVHKNVPLPLNTTTDRKSVVSGKSVSVRVALGGRRIIKKKK